MMTRSTDRGVGPRRGSFQIRYVELENGLLRIVCAGSLARPGLTTMVMMNARHVRTCPQVLPARAVEGKALAEPLAGSLHEIRRLIWRFALHGDA